MLLEQTKKLERLWKEKKNEGTNRVSVSAKSQSCITEELSSLVLPSRKNLDQYKCLDIPLRRRSRSKRMHCQLSDSEFPMTTRLCTLQLWMALSLCLLSKRKMLRNLIETFLQSYPHQKFLSRRSNVMFFKPIYDNWRNRSEQRKEMLQKLSKPKGKGS